ncbi:methyl-accepting chemotaxis protein [Methylibium rhizosphaerae]|uniref:methyl-accepting chemotaxis protein n=1 Tax=Methylibium rhizosphaerae TaxID=2570323 RepID=UPI001FE3ABD7|nr:methyl-accepting chemotaxis protein [Methylibium rhizosphaerae]
MKTFNNLRIGMRLGICFALCVAVMLALLVLAKLGLDHVNEDVALINEDRYPKVRWATDIKDAVNQIARSAAALVIVETDAERAAEQKTIAESRDTIRLTLEKLDKQITTEQGREHFTKLMEARAVYVRELDAMLQAVGAGDAVRMRTQLVSKVRPAQQHYLQVLASFADFQEDLMRKAGEDAAATVQRSEMMMFAAALAGSLLAAAAAWFVTRSITRPINEAVQVARTVASGDLTSHIDSGDRRDEAGQLLQALASMNSSLLDVVARVRNGSDSIATGAGQIAAGNADLSQRTEEQASNLQQTAASMEQMTSTVRNNADTAQQANQLAAGAASAAGHGGKVVDQVVVTMEEISQASRKIADIIGVIDGIAFQTNILALNAAVEAARAGEQGRGFAVVAGEVRALAQRSANAAREVKSLIGHSAEKVENGTRLVSEAGRSMQDIVTQVQRVSQLINDISNATVEQSSGITQVGQAMAQLDQVTQQNAALVEESAAAAESLNQQAARLVEAVNAFKLHAADVSGDAAAQATPTPRGATATQTRTQGVPAGAAALAGAAA